MAEIVSEIHHITQCDFVLHSLFRVRLRGKSGVGFPKASSWRDMWEGYVRGIMGIMYQSATLFPVLGGHATCAYRLAL